MVDVLTTEELFDNKTKIDNRLRAAISGEASGGSVEEKEYVASVFLREQKKNGTERALKRSSAYTTLSNQYRKSLSKDFNEIERKDNEETNKVINNLLTDPSKIKEVDGFENTEAFGESIESLLSDERIKVGRQEFFKMPSRKEQEKKIQQGLKDKGFNPGKIDGVRGKRTINAIKSFQKENDLKQDGIPGKNTLRKLLGIANIFGVKEAEAGQETFSTEELFGPQDEILSTEDLFGEPLSGDPKDDLSFMQKVLTSKPSEIITQSAEFFDNIKTSFKRGSVSAEIDQASYLAMQGKLDYEKDVKPLKDKQEEIANADPVKGKNIISNALYSVAQMLPAMGQGIIEGQTTGAVAGLTTAATGVFSGLALPMYAAGVVSGGMSYWYRQGAGQIYSELKDERRDPVYKTIDGVKVEVTPEKIPDNIIKPIANIAGAMYAAIEYSQVETLIPGTKQVARKLISDSVRKTIARLGMKYGTNWANEVGEEGVQEIVLSAAQEVAKDIAEKGYIKKEGENIPEYIQRRIDKNTEVAKKVMVQGWEAVKESALPMIFLLGPSAASDVANIMPDEKIKGEVRKEIVRRVIDEAKEEEKRQGVAEGVEVEGEALEEGILPPAVGVEGEVAPVKVGQPSAEVVETTKQAPEKPVEKPITKLEQETRALEARSKELDKKLAERKLQREIEKPVVARPVTGEGVVEPSLIEEAKKYKTAEEFVAKVINKAKINAFLEDGNLFIQTIETPDTLQKQGLASQKIVDTIIKEKAKYVTPSTQSKGGKALFNSLEKKGILEKVDSDTYNSRMLRKQQVGTYKVNTAKLESLNTKSQLTSIFNQAQQAKGEVEKKNWPAIDVIESPDIRAAKTKDTFAFPKEFTTEGHKEKHVTERKTKDPVSVPTEEEISKMTGGERADQVMEKYNSELAPNAFGDTRPKIRRGDKDWTRIKEEHEKEFAQKPESAILKSEVKEDVKPTEPTTGRAASERTPTGNAGDTLESRTDNRSGSRVDPNEVRDTAEEKKTSKNYRITATDTFATRTPGQKSRYQQNIASIKLLKEIESQDRKATNEEKAILIKYVGWGGLSQAFDEKITSWTREYSELKGLLTKEEYEAARASTINAHYTSHEIISSMWKAMSQLGFKSGKVLEPASGTGHFMGLGPQSKVAYTGVELDSLTGRIAKQLYPESDIHVKGFQEVPIPQNYYDLAISNVPFSGYKPFDAQAKSMGIPSGLVLHDFFFAKAMSSLKPGGVMAFITSKGTMDKQGKDFREYMSKQAKLLGAIRLPNTAFKGNAGTEVVTDIIFLQKLRKGETSNAEAWGDTVPLTYEGKETQYNKYFKDNPNAVLGIMRVGSGLYNKNELTVDPLQNKNGELPIEEEIDRAVRNILPKDIFKHTNEEGRDRSEIETIEDSSNLKDGAFKYEKGKVFQKQGTKLVEQTVSSGNTQRLAGMIKIRDIIRDLLALQIKDVSDADLVKHQKSLNSSYDSFVKKYGYISDKANEDLFEDDPDAPLISSLEVYTKKVGRKKQYKKGDIFNQRVIQPHRKPTTAKNPKDALYISLAEYGTMDFEYMSDLLKKPESEIQSTLKEEGLIFENPTEENTFIIRDEYLSGNVKEKFAEAKLVKDKLRFSKNVSELEKVIPKDLPYNKISVKLGVPWISEETYSKFFGELLGANTSTWGPTVSVVHDSKDGRWKTVHTNMNSYRVSTANTETYGTDYFPAVRLIDYIMNSKQIKVMKPTGELNDKGKPKMELDQDKTAVMKFKADQIKAKFNDWLWEDQARREFHTAEYNKRFNTTIERSYNGDYLIFPSMNPNAFPKGLRSTQKNAIVRGITTDRMMAAHSVGSGKTAIITAIAMESKRMGIVNKSMVVAPKNTISGWKKEINHLYPTARVLIANPKNFIGINRKKFVSKIATGNWDIVVIPEPSFGLIPVSAETQIEYINEELNDMRDSKNKMKEAGAKISVKRIEAAILALEAKLQRILSETKKDDIVTFEELGVDALYIDEADKFKNLRYSTQKSAKGMGTATGNQKTADMMMKARILNGKKGSKIVFATGTPISNSMVEVHAMMKYLQPDLLDRLGLKSFDDWSNMFGEVVSSLEVDVTGVQFSMQDRFKKFINVPELMSMLTETWDIQTQQMLEDSGVLVPGVNLPLLKGDGKTPYILDSYPELDAYTDTLIARTEAIKKRKGRPQKGDDIMLVVLQDGLKASIDMRMIDPLMKPNSNSKVEVTLKELISRWKKGKKEKTTQVVFLDRIKPDKNAPFNPQYYMKKQLMKSGVPEKEIAFIHDYETEDKQADLFQKVNDGDVRIIFGSTEKLGAGTNMQERLDTLYHMDQPYRPRDITQREGRIIRPGNRNKEVEVLRLSTKNTLDTFMWQMLEAKSKSIEQVMQRDFKGNRDYDEEVGINEYEALKSLTSGNPLVQERAELDRDIRALTAVETQQKTHKYKAQDVVAKHDENIKIKEDRIKEAEDFILSRPEKPTKETFSIEIKGKKYTEKKDAHEVISSELMKIRSEDYGIKQSIGEYLGESLFVMKELKYDKINNYVGIGNYRGKVSQDTIGTFVSLDTEIFSRPESDIEYFKESIKKFEQQLIDAKATISKTIEGVGDLDKKRQRLREVEQELQGTSVKDVEEDIGKDSVDDLDFMGSGPQLPQSVKKVVNDKIEGGVKFSDPEIEKRFSQSKGIQNPNTLKARIKAMLTELSARATRVYPHLPNEARFAPLRNILSKQKVARSNSQDRAIRAIDAITAGFGPKKTDLFTRKIILDDLLREHTAGRNIPFGYSENIDALLIDKENIDRVVEQNPDVKEAIDKRNRLWKAITADLVRYDILKKSQVKEDYFRHQVLEYANMKATFGSGKKIRSPSPGYARKRIGSTFDINTDYAQAEFEVMSQALHDIETAKNIKEIENSPLNISDDLKQQAKARNYEKVVGGLENVKELEQLRAEKSMITDPGEVKELSDRIWELDPLMPFNKKIAIGISSLEKELDARGFDIKEIADLAEKGNLNARSVMKAISDKENLIRTTLGENYLKWKTQVDSRMIPEGYTPWQPKEGNIFFSASSIPQKIANELMDNLGESIGININDVKKIMALGGKRKEFILPMEVADTLDNLYNFKNPNFITNATKKLTTYWKRWVLMNPRRAFKYNYQNFLGDFDAVIAGDPRILRKMLHANGELIDVFYKGKPMSKDLREFVERGGISTQMTVQELPELNKLEIFQRLAEKSGYDLKRHLNLWQKYWQTIGTATTFRESILRYAAYLHYKDLFVNGKKANYGASIRAEVDALSDPIDKAAKVSTELLGDYSNITALGQDMRESLIPFYSWLEINAKRYFRLFRNSFDEGWRSGIRASTTVAGMKGSFFLAKWLLRAAAMTAMIGFYNHLRFPDEEAELSEYDKNRMHIILGRDKNGKILLLRGQTAFADILEWVGLDGSPTYWKEVTEGKSSFADMFGRIPLTDFPAFGLNPLEGKVGLHPAAMKFMRGVNPFFKLPFETLTGKSLPVFDDRSWRIDDKMKNILRTFSLENEYDYLMKEPTRGYKRSLIEAIITTQDPEENAYRYIQGQKYKFLETVKGKGGSSDYYSPRSVLYRKYKKAIRFNGKGAIDRIKKEMDKIGMNERDINESLRSTDPLSGLSRADREEFQSSYLTQRDREIYLKKANEYYIKTFRSGNI